MATITIGGLATGLDTDSIVSQLVAIERQRGVGALQTQRTDANTRRIALQNFNGKVAAFLTAVNKLKNPDDVIVRKASSSNENVLTATAGSGAHNGTTEITVDRLARSAIATSANGKAAATSTVATGSGTFAFRVGPSGPVQTLAVDATTTLTDLAAAINALDAGATASVVNVGTTASPDYRLRLASDTTGTESAVSIVTDDTTLGVSVTQAAQNATFTVSGFATPFSRESNVVNDVGDEVTGGDRVNEERIYPYTGGSRFIQNRIMTVEEMNRWGQVLLAAAAGLGLVLTLMKGPLVLLLGLAGIAIGVLYSIPAVQLSARGVGEACIAIAFGLLPVCGAAWLQSGLIDWASVLVAIPVGLWVTLILLINEVPDRKADETSGKRTLVVRMGAAGTRRLYQALHVVAFACVAALVLTRLMPWWIAAGGIAILLGGFKASAGIGDAAQGRAALTKSIEMTLGLQVAGSVLLILGAIFAS